MWGSNFCSGERMGRGLADSGLPWPVDPFLPKAVLALPFLGPAPPLIGILRGGRSNDSVFQAEEGSG